MLAIFKREVRSYFYSPIAYVLIGVFIVLTSIFFLFNNLGAFSANFNDTLSTMGFLLIFIVPMLTMKTIAEDRKNGTEVMLVTSPSSLTGVVVGKYLAVSLVFVVMTVITFIYPLILKAFGEPPLAQLMSGYLGFILMGGAIISVGVFASSLTENQVIAAVTSLVMLLVIWLIEPLGSFLGGNAAQVLKQLSLPARYEKFNTGILNVSDIVFFLSFIAVFIFLTIRVIEKRRWSQG